MSSKKRKVSHECFQIPDFCHRTSSEKVLSDLPDEILTEIFGYLTPQSLVQISNLRNQRLTGAACFKAADFSMCNTINLEDVQSFFTKERRNLIQEINFNNVFFVLPSTLTNCIVKCKNITKLYVFNCGLDYSHISNIFNNCKALLECYWSVPEVDDDCVKLLKPIGISNSLKKFYLQLQEENINPNIISILNMCPNAEEVCINYTPCYITAAPADLSTRHFCFKFTLKTRNVAINIVSTCQSNVCPHKIKSFMQRMNMQKRLSQELIDIEEKSDTSFKVRHYDFLQLFAEKELLDNLPELPNESVNSLVILLNDNFYHMASHLDRIKRMTGKALNHFSLSKHDNTLSYHMAPHTENNHIFTILSGILKSTVNITVLSLSELHMPCDFPVPTNIPLKHLKVFNICACCLAVSDEEYEHSEVCERTGKASFEKFVLNCTKVEKFGLYGCRKCRFGPTDKELIPISFWKLLKCLTIEHVCSLRQCWFLAQIATKCPKLKMVELVQISDPNVCHYIPSVVQILKKSKELVFLRINQNGFYPMDSLFWKAVGSAQNLQGLCLKTSVSTYIDNKRILEPLHKLSFIHLFHLVAKGTCGNLKTHVKRIMCDNGVKIPDIITTVDCGRPFDACSKRHFAMI